MRLLINLQNRTRAQSAYVVVPRKEYQRFVKYQAELKEALRKIRRGARDLRSGLAWEINSVRDLM